MRADAKLFVHVFAHRALAYHFEVRDGGDWMSKYFFTGGTMPSEALLLNFQDDLEECAQSDSARVQRKADEWDSHDTVLAKSAFASLERVSIVETRRVPVESLSARPLSMSSLSRERLGDRLDDLLARIGPLLDAHAIDGWLDERIESTALIARRPAARG